MGYVFTAANLNAVLKELGKRYRLFAPQRYALDGAYSDTDTVRYAEVKTIEEIELRQKSSFSYKEAILPISETLFFYTEDEVKTADPPGKAALIFLRSCDMHAVKCLDEIYLRNGTEDYYYKRLRESAKFVLIGCAAAFENCFCVDMNTNISTDYDASLDEKDGKYYVDNKNDAWTDLFSSVAESEEEVTPAHVTETATRVRLPEGADGKMLLHPMWEQYDARCISCGRCNYSCPTCTCFSMQDIFYTDNGKVGERRRVWASCMVDGFTDVAGGGSYRKTPGQRMRFRVMHKVADYKDRFGYHMCVGCGRCDDVCPEYISFSTAVTELANQMEKLNRRVDE